MMGAGHRLAAVSTVLGIAAVLDVPPGQVLLTVALAVPFSAGSLSPDADHTWLSVFGHRRGVHGWWWPALAAALLASSSVAGAFPCWGPVLGWGSHLVADALFGKAGHGTPRGIPVLPFCGWRFGTGWRVASRRRRGGHAPGEMVATWTLVPVIGWQLWLLIVP